MAFIQNSGVIGQAVDFAEAGTYQLSVTQTQRGNHSGGSDEEVEVLVDGTVVGTINPASTSYATYTTGSFSVTAGSHIIKFVGIDPSGADYTALLDQVNIVNVARTGFSDPGFESPSQGSGESAYEYDPAGSTWSFSGGAGLAGNGSAFTAGNPDAPQGSQVAFIQRTGTASQVVVFPSSSAGSYQITLSAAQRGNHSGGSNEEIEVMVDGSVVGTFTPASTSYANYTTASFSVMAGSHTIASSGSTPAGPTTPRSSIKSALITLRRRRSLTPVLRPRARGRARSLTRMIRRLVVDFQQLVRLVGQRQRHNQRQPQRATGEPGCLHPEYRHDQPGGEFRDGRFLPDQRQRRPAGQLPGG